MKIGTVQFDSALFLGATFRQGKLIPDTLYAVALKPGELLKGWKLFSLDRTTGFIRRSSPIPHCCGHSHLATQLLPDPTKAESVPGQRNQNLATSSDVFTVFNLTIASSHVTCWLPKCKALLALVIFSQLKIIMTNVETTAFFSYKRNSTMPSVFPNKNVLV